MAKRKTKTKSRKRVKQGKKNIHLGGSYPIKGTGRLGGGGGGVPYFITQYIEPARHIEPTTSLDWVRGERLPEDVKGRIKMQKGAEKIRAPSGMMQVAPTPKAPLGGASLSRQMDVDIMDIPKPVEHMQVDMTPGGMPYVEREVPTRGEGKSLTRPSISQAGGEDYKRPSAKHRPLLNLDEDERMDVDLPSGIHAPAIAEPMAISEPRQFESERARASVPRFAPSNQLAPNRVIQPRDVTPLQPPSDDATTGPTSGLGRSLGVPQGVVGGRSGNRSIQKAIMTAGSLREPPSSQIDPALIRALEPWPAPDPGLPLPKFQGAEFTFAVRGTFDYAPRPVPVKWPGQQEPHVPAHELTGKEDISEEQMMADVHLSGRKRGHHEISPAPQRSMLRKRVVGETTKKARKGDNLRSINLDGKVVRI